MSSIPETDLRLKKSTDGNRQEISPSTGIWGWDIVEMVVLYRGVGDDFVRQLFPKCIWPVVIKRKM